MSDEKDNRPHPVLAATTPELDVALWQAHQSFPQYVEERTAEFVRNARLDGRSLEQIAHVLLRVAQELETRQRK